MRRRRGFNAVLLAAIAANALLIVDALTVNLLVPPVEAQEMAEQPVAPLDPADAGYVEAQQTYLELIDELERHEQQLEQRQAEVAERERQLEVVRTEFEAEKARLDKLAQQVEAERREVAAQGSPSFDRLLKAYEMMEPENAAGALAELYARDQSVVVDLLLGLKPRQAGATLDALAADRPAIAAELSHEIWRRDPTTGAR
jgi:flagellar motility protein MotE (MotC chaperone)